MTAEDRDELLCRIDERVERLETTLLNNGHGWCQARLERIEALERAQAKTSGAINILSWLVGILATAASAVVAVFLRQR